MLQLLLRVPDLSISGVRLRLGPRLSCTRILCRGCNQVPDGEADMPLVSVLRDTLGDDTPANGPFDGSMAAYLHTSDGPATLCFLPYRFFYWHVPRGSEKKKLRSIGPAP